MTKDIMMQQTQQESSHYYKDIANDPIRLTFWLGSMAD